MHGASINGERVWSRVGSLLREWRLARGLSQLDLGLRAGFSTRHLSFIETGRSQPSRDALLVLAEALDVPLKGRNQLLEAGGYAACYRHTPFNASEMEHVRNVLQFILDRHSPYPALILDHYSDCLMGNNASAKLLACLVDPSLITPRANHLRAVFHPLGAHRWITNWDEIGSILLSRAEREFADEQDDRSVALLAEVRGYASSSLLKPRLRFPDPVDVLMPIQIRKGDLELSLFSTIMTVGTPQDITLQELRIETFFPADQQSERTWTDICADRHAGC